MDVRTCAYSSVAVLSAGFDSKGNEGRTTLLTESNEAGASEATNIAHHAKVSIHIFPVTLICLKYLLYLVAKVFVRMIIRFL